MKFMNSKTQSCTRDAIFSSTSLVSHVSKKILLKPIDTYVYTHTYKYTRNTGKQSEHLVIVLDHFFLVFFFSFFRISSSSMKIHFQFFFS